MQKREVTKLASFGIVLLTELLKVWFIEVYEDKNVYEDKKQ